MSRPHRRHRQAKVASWAELAGSPATKPKAALATVRPRSVASVPSSSSAPSSCQLVRGARAGPGIDAARADPAGPVPVTDDLVTGLDGDARHGATAIQSLNPAFDERNYGSRSFLVFLSKLPDVVEVTRAGPDRTSASR